MCVCPQVSQQVLLCHPEVSTTPNALSYVSTPYYVLPKLQHRLIFLTDHPNVSDRNIPHGSIPHPLVFFFCSSFCFFVFFYLLSFVWLWVLCVCVFSPATSVDYGSFADRCSTWLELLRLKAHTIRRGSVKTSRRTQSRSHSAGHVQRYIAHTCTCIHSHMSYKHPCILLW